VSDIITTTQQSGAFDLVQRRAKAYAASDIVPKQFKGNVANCIVAIEIADRLGISWLAAMQNLVIIHGKPSWQATFLIAMVNQSRRFETLRYIYEGKPGEDSWGCKVVTIERSTGAEIEGPAVTIGMAKADGWYQKEGSKWKTLPQLMLMYRAAAFFSRTFCPELSLGMQTVDEAIEAVPRMEISLEPRTIGELMTRSPAKLETKRASEQSELVVEPQSAVDVT
jgi:hypothetical protein